jgi:hypothetical protein
MNLFWKIGLKVGPQRELLMLTAKNSGVDDIGSIIGEGNP